MSGFLALLLAAGAGVVNPMAAASSIGDQNIGGGASAGGVTFNADGTVSYTFTGISNEGNQATPRWYSNQQAGIGSFYWVRATVTAGALTTGTTGAWLALSAGQSFVKGPSNSGNTSATVTFEFATDAAGANIVSTSAGWSIGYTHT